MEKVITNMNVSKKILASAYKCISQKGYAKASLRDIAEDAGVALSQLNYYYKNKEGLFTEVVNELSNDYIKEIELMFLKGSSAKEKLNNLIIYFKNIMYDKPETNRLLFDLISMSIWNTSFKSLLSGLFDKVSELIRKYIFEDSALKHKYDDFTANSLSKSIVGTIFGTAMQYILNPSDKAIIESLNCIDLSLE
jgi:AcrR family transcriptional regulator